MTHNRFCEGAFYLLVAHDPIPMKQNVLDKNMKNKNKKKTEKYMYFKRKFVTTDSNSARSRFYTIKSLKFLNDKPTNWNFRLK